MKIVVSNPKDGKSYQAEVPKEKEGSLIGKIVGNEIDGGIVGASGYTLKITGGSDFAGFPIRHDVSGPKRMTTLLAGGAGFRQKVRGERKTKTIRGNMISDETMQINTVVATPGDKTLEELMPKAAGDKKDEKKR